MDRSKVIESLRQYRRKLSRSMRIDSILFFGSIARGKGGKYSDIDLLVVSRDFEGKRFIKRPLGLYEKWELDMPVDILCYTPREIEEKKRHGWGIVSVALREGIEVS